jgi:hypothetical protein
MKYLIAARRYRSFTVAARPEVSLRKDSVDWPMLPRITSISRTQEGDLSSDPGRFMSDAATAYAAMALESAK